MKEWKAPEKEAQKMTRDGAVSVNLVTGETTYPSNRTPEQDHSASGDTAGAAGKVVDRAELHREQAAAKKKRRKQRRAYREGEAAASRPSSRLQFSEADRAVPELQGAIRKSDKAADRLDAAKAAVPSKPPSPQHTNPLSRPIQEAGAAIHGKVREVEQENSGVQSGHLGERGIEKAVGYGNRRVQNWRAERKLKPWQDAAKAEQAAVKANADFYYRKAVAENPQLASNPVSRLWQKRKLQKQYAAAYRAAGKTAQAGKTAEATAKAAKKTAQESKRTVLFVKRHWKGALIVGGIGLLLVMLLGSLQSCSSMFGGGVSNIMASSYLSEDADMLAAEEAYCAKEDELREYLDTYEATHDYDEYHFNLDEIEHDPYVLISILSALHEGVFTIDQVQGDLQTLFDKQYILTETVTTETRYRTETRTDSEGNPYTVRVPYTWTICTVTLENFDLSHVPVYMMGEEQLSLYATYMSTLGNRPDLFPSSGYVNKYIENPPTAWEIPSEYLTDERFNTLITEAEKYLGYPYVWGGSSPSTSFDCSGFVSYVLTNSGLCNTGRLGAQGLYNISTPVSDPQPGDLVFFVGTYDTSGVSHVGIYVGDGMMLHCGDPIQYSNLNTSYWQSHFYAYGRPPYNYMVSYGGGANSTALLIGLHQHRIPVDLILFADTGAEHPHTYAYLEVMDRWLKDHGMPPITRVYKTTRDGKRLTLEDECLQSCSLPSIAYGFKRCSLKHKIGPQEKFCNHYPPCRRTWAAGKRVVKFIGYDAGDGYRSDKVLLGDLADRKYSKWYPLMEWGWTRDDCIRQIEAAGLPQPGKSSCFFCPSMKPDEITALREQHPDLFRRALALEDNARKNLKTVKGLGRNYSWRERFGKEFCTHGNG